MTPPSNDPLLEASGLTRAFGPRRVLRGVDLTLQRSEVLAVVGPNGAGKTTLLRLLAGLMRPTSGTVRILGRRVVSSDADSRRPIGLLSHQSLLYDDLSVRENLLFTARLHGMAHPAEAADAMLAAVGLSERAGESPRRLSRGLLQRAAIARALIHEPALVLLDEPFTGLDAPSSDKLRRLLRDTLGGGRGVVVVTHNLAEVWDLATRVAVLSGGRWALEQPRGGALDEFLPRYHELIGV